MTESPSAPVATGLQDADHPEDVIPLTRRRMHPLQIAAIGLLFLVLSLLAAVVFLGITIGVTIVAANLIPKPANVLAPLLGVGLATLCFGGASRIRKGMFKNRYGILHRPPRNPSGQRRGRR
jgi:hypothetical protein